MKFLGLSVLVLYSCLSYGEISVNEQIEQAIAKDSFVSQAKATISSSYDKCEDQDISTLPTTEDDAPLSGDWKFYSYTLCDDHNGDPYSAEQVIVIEGQYDSETKSLGNVTVTRSKCYWDFCGI